MITYFEYYPHYMGTMTATVQFTEKQFDKMLELAKGAIKEHKDGDGDDRPAYQKLDDFVTAIEKDKKVTVYALTEALLNYFGSPRRPSSIKAAIKKKGVWAGEWEEGSHAFATTKKKAQDAVKAIEIKHCMMDDF